MIGGGAKSPPWLQLLSDILGLELRTINTAEGGGLGAVILAMTGCGHFKSVEEGCAALIRDVKVYQPHADETARFAAKFAKLKNCMSGSRAPDDQRHMKGAFGALHAAFRRPSGECNERFD